jgi:hypothetical protein
VPASPRLLDALREYWRVHRPSNFLFPGKTADVPLSSATIQKACRLSAAQAGIKNIVTPHTLRHSYATSMLEAGVDLLTISKLLGHSSFVTTMIYLHVRRQHFDRSPSPLDWLPVRQCPQWAEPRQTPVASPATPTPPPATTPAAQPPASEPPATETDVVSPPSDPDPPTTGTQPQRRTSGRRKNKRRPRRRRE